MQQLVWDIKEPPPKAARRPENWMPIQSLPELHGFIGFDTETKDPGLGDGRGSSWAFPDEGFVTGASFACEDRSFYVGIRHSDGNIDPVLFRRWLKAQAAKPDVTFICANAPYDTGWSLTDLGITFANTPYDVQGMATLIDENRLSYTLNALSRIYLGEEKNEAALLTAARACGISHPKSNMDKMPAWLVEPYAIPDAVLARKLFFKLMPLIEQGGLQEVLELERESIMVAVDMRRRGVRIDLDFVAQLKAEFIGRRDDAIGIVQALTGVAISPWDGQAISRALVEENPELKLGTTVNGKTSVRADVLEGIATPVANMIVEARRLDKLISTFLEGYLENMHRNGRVHADFHPTRRTSEEGNNSGVAGARFASSNPNLQNIPIRTDDGKRIRQAFIPEEGEEWMKLDYASQEPRLTVHFAALARRRGAQAMVDRFNADPNTDLHAETAEAMGIDRKRAKTINLGIAYGMQGAKLCHSLGLLTEMKYIERLGREIEVAGTEGAALLRNHHRSMPFIKDLFEMAKTTAASRGYVMTLMKRHCHFPRAGEGEYMFTHKALNKVIQNSAAEQMKKALIAMRRAGIPVLLTVHDESDFSKPMGERGERMKRDCIEIMEQAVRLLVPVIAECEIGDNWGALTKMN